METTSAAELMDRFAARTGLSSEERPRRYLWTDAFAVCNFLQLAHLSGEGRYARLAAELVDQVHHTLGRHRDDDEREGWLSGLSDEEAEAHPTRGGLRIGKPLPERGPDERVNPRLEWERDGQYFHYLTKWMHALDMMARATAEARYSLWAGELAKVAVDAFTYTPRRGDGRRMFWKMSIDLSRPQVASMGQHDPLDGFVTCKQLEMRASMAKDATRAVDLSDELRLLWQMVRGHDFTTSDPLSLGGLLMDAERLDHLARCEVAVLDDEERRLESEVLDAAARGLQRWGVNRPLAKPAAERLAFRELGLAIGLYALEKIAGADVAGKYARFRPFSKCRDDIVAFWRRPENRDNRTWRDHEDINDVMLATALMPDACML